MRALLIVLFTVFISFSASAQKKKKKSIDTTANKPVPEVKAMTQDSFYTMIFRNGMKYGDYQVAATALYSLMVLQPSNESLKDSLVLLYNGMGNSVQAILIAREILLKNPNNPHVLNAKAQSEQRLGLYKEALESYETLFDKTQNLYDLYQVASLQYTMKRFMEAQNTLAYIIKSPKSGTEKISITGSNNQEQVVNFKAAAYNLLGVVALEMKAYPDAQSNFKKALEFEPDFELAQSNLQILTAEMNKQKTPNTNTGKTNTKTPVRK